MTLTFNLWSWKSIWFQILLRTKYVPSLVKIHWRMLILECSQGLWRTDGRTEGRTDGSFTISPRNFVGEGIKSQENKQSLYNYQLTHVVNIIWGKHSETHWRRDVFFWVLHYLSDHLEISYYLLLNTIIWPYCGVICYLSPSISSRKHVLKHYLYVNEINKYKEPYKSKRDGRPPTTKDRSAFCHDENKDIVVSIQMAEWYNWKL